VDEPLRAVASHDRDRVDGDEFDSMQEFLAIILGRCRGPKEIEPITYDFTQVSTRVWRDNPSDELLAVVSKLIEAVPELGHCFEEHAAEYDPPLAYVYLSAAVRYLESQLQSGTLTEDVCSRCSSRRGVVTVVRPARKRSNRARATRSDCRQLRV
jgi:hypothetical protein